jgi:hypothetical protein
MRILALAPCLCLVLILPACVAPQKISKTQQDKARFDQEQSERSANENCNQDAMPGTPQHLACRLSSEHQK